MRLTVDMHKHAEGWRHDEGKWAPTEWRTCKYIQHWKCTSTENTKREQGHQTTWYTQAISFVLLDRTAVNIRANKLNDWTVDTVIQEIMLCPGISA